MKDGGGWRVYSSVDFSPVTFIQRAPAAARPQEGHSGHAHTPALFELALATFAASARQTPAAPALARRAAVLLIRMCLFHLSQETHFCLSLPSALKKRGTDLREKVGEDE